MPKSFWGLSLASLLVCAPFLACTHQPTNDSVHDSVHEAAHNSGHDFGRATTSDAQGWGDETKITSIMNDNTQITDLADYTPRRQPANSDGPAITPDYKPNQSFVILSDPQLMESLENNGFSLANQLGGQGNPDNKTLFAQSPIFDSLTSNIGKDLVDLQNDENKFVKQGLPQVGVGVRFSRRLFDLNWLKSPNAKFELVGVLNRQDRASFADSPCGEIRFIYRLAYKTKRIYSRLPMTLLMKYYVNGQKGDQRSCEVVAKRWKYPTGLNTNAQLLDWITKSGPLNNQNITFGDYHTMELNFQAMRTPSEARRGLAGEGAYVLRVYKRNGNSLDAQFLENTPDVDKLNSTPALKQEFLSQLNDRHFVAKLSAGILLLDDKYLTKKAVSYSPYGIARQDNRPYDKFIKESDLAAIKFNPEGYVRSASAAIKRLNDMSCISCHQGRTHAGFHFLGVDRNVTNPLNSIMFEGSGHLAVDLKRRLNYVIALQDGNVLDPKRDLSLGPAAGEQAGRGHFCGMPGSSFNHWQCAAGLTCKQMDEAANEKELGKCIPSDAISGDGTSFGSITQASHEFDTFDIKSVITCGPANARGAYGGADVGGGFPSGLCYRRGCGGANANLETCALSAGMGFNQCVAKTQTGETTFAECLAKNAAPVGYGRCSSHQQCRNDYLCGKNSKGEGFCTPSYFMFQIRLDGHPDPMTTN